MSGAANAAAESTPNSRRDKAPLTLSLSIRISSSEKERGVKKSSRRLFLPLAGQAIVTCIGQSFKPPRRHHIDEPSIKTRRSHRSGAHRSELRASRKPRDVSG